MLTQNEKQKLLNNREVVEEINRHLWIESEKSGRDIGFQAAAEDWLNRFAIEWLKYHLPNYKPQATNKEESKPEILVISKKEQTAAATVASEEHKKSRPRSQRSAKSYVFAKSR